MNKIPVSVIIPVYNVERYIERCARSVLGQTLLDVEIVFIDDCTPDSSMEIVDSVLKDYPQRAGQVKIIHHQQNKGLASARRTGLDHASGEYVGWVDSDDWVERDMFEKMYVKAKEANADIVCCDIFRERKDGRKEERYPYDEENPDIVMAHPEYGIYSAVWNKLVRRTLYTANNIYPLETISMWEDFAVTLRLRYISKKTVICHQCLYHYNNANETAMTVAKNEKKQKDQLQCLDFLTSWFKNRIPDKHWIMLMQFCFQTKSFLFFPPTYNLLAWRTILSESNEYIWTCSSVSLLRKIEYWLMTVLPFGVADRILRFRYRL